MSTDRQAVGNPDRWATLRRLCVDGYLAVPRIEGHLAEQIYRRFDDVIALAGTSGWADAFNRVAKDWKDRERASLSHSGFFGPYYRDRNGRSTSDQKVVYQTCPAFIQELLASTGVAACDFYPTPVRELDALLNEALLWVLPIFTEVTAALVQAAPVLEGLLYDDAGKPILSARVLKYTPDPLAGTNPHVDKSALTCILHNTDSPGRGSLVIASPSTSRPRLSEFAPAAGHAAVLFPGQAFDEAGFRLVQPTGHAVLSIDTCVPRYSLVAFWLMRRVNLADFDTTVEVDDDLQVLRAYARKPSTRPEMASDGARNA